MALTTALQVIAATMNVSARISPVELNHTIVIAAALMLLALPCNLANKLLAGYQELERSALATGAGAGYSEWLPLRMAAASR